MSVGLELLGLHRTRAVGNARVQLMLKPLWAVFLPHSRSISGVFQSESVVQPSQRQPQSLR